MSDNISIAAAAEELFSTSSILKLTDTKIVALKANEESLSTGVDEAGTHCMKLRPCKKREKESVWLESKKKHDYLSTSQLVFLRPLQVEFMLRVGWVTAEIRHPLGDLVTVLFSCQVHHDELRFRAWTTTADENYELLRCKGCRKMGRQWAQKQGERIFCARAFIWRKKGASAGFGQHTDFKHVPVEPAKLEPATKGPMSRVPSMLNKIVEEKRLKRANTPKKKRKRKRKSTTPTSVAIDNATPLMGPASADGGEGTLPTTDGWYLAPLLVTGDILLYYPLQEFEPTNLALLDTENSTGFRQDPNSSFQDDRASDSALDSFLLSQEAVNALSSSAEVTAAASSSLGAGAQPESLEVPHLKLSLSEKQLAQLKSGVGCHQTVARKLSDSCEDGFSSPKKKPRAGD